MDTQSPAPSPDSDARMGDEVEVAEEVTPPPPVPSDAPTLDSAAAAVGFGDSCSAPAAADAETSATPASASSAAGSSHSSHSRSPDPTTHGAASTVFASSQASVSVVSPLRSSAASASTASSPAAAASSASKTAAAAANSTNSLCNAEQIQEKARQMASQLGLGEQASEAVNKDTDGVHVPKEDEKQGEGDNCNMAEETADAAVHVPSARVSPLLPRPNAPLIDPCATLLEHPYSLFTFSAAQLQGAVQGLDVKTYMGNLNRRWQFTIGLIGVHQHLYNRNEADPSALVVEESKEEEQAGGACAASSSASTLLPDGREHRKKWKELFDKEEKTNPNAIRNALRKTYDTALSSDATGVCSTSPKTQKREIIDFVKDLYRGLCTYGNFTKVLVLLNETGITYVLELHKLWKPLKAPVPFGVFHSIMKKFPRHNGKLSISTKQLRDAVQLVNHDEDMQILLRDRDRGAELTMAFTELLVDVVDKRAILNRKRTNGDDEKGAAAKGNHLSGEGEGEDGGDGGEGEGEGNGEGDEEGEENKDGESGGEDDEEKAESDPNSKRNGKKKSKDENPNKRRKLLKEVQELRKEKTLLETKLAEALFDLNHTLEVTVKNNEDRCIRLIQRAQMERDEGLENQRRVFQVYLQQQQTFSRDSRTQVSCSSELTGLTGLSPFIITDAVPLSAKGGLGRIGRGALVKADRPDFIPRIYYDSGELPADAPPRHDCVFKQTYAPRLGNTKFIFVEIEVLRRIRAAGTDASPHLPRFYTMANILVTPVEAALGFAMQPVIAMEWVRGLNLHETLKMAAPRTPAAPGQQAVAAGVFAKEVTSARGCLHSMSARLELALQFVRAVVALHKMGVVHRDLKPANVLIAHPQLYELTATKTNLWGSPVVVADEAAREELLSNARKCVIPDGYRPGAVRATDSSPSVRVVVTDFNLSLLTSDEDRYDPDLNRVKEFHEANGFVRWTGGTDMYNESCWMHKLSSVARVPLPVPAKPLAVAVPASPPVQQPAAAASSSSSAAGVGAAAASVVPASASAAPAPPPLSSDAAASSSAAPAPAVTADASSSPSSSSSSLSSSSSHHVSDSIWRDFDQFGASIVILDMLRMCPLLPAVGKTPEDMFKHFTSFMIINRPTEWDGEIRLRESVSLYLRALKDKASAVSLYGPAFVEANMKLTAFLKGHPVLMQTLQAMSQPRTKALAHEVSELVPLMEQVEQVLLETLATVKEEEKKQADEHPDESVDDEDEAEVEAKQDAAESSKESQPRRRKRKRIAHEEEDGKEGEGQLLLYRAFDFSSHSDSTSTDAKRKQPTRFTARRMHSGREASIEHPVVRDYLGQVVELAEEAKNIMKMIQEAERAEEREEEEQSEQEVAEMEEDMQGEPVVPLSTEELTEVKGVVTAMVDTVDEMADRRNEPELVGQAHAAVVEPVDEEVDMQLSNMETEQRTTAAEAAAAAAAAAALAASDGGEQSGTPSQQSEAVAHAAANSTSAPSKPPARILARRACVAKDSTCRWIRKPDDAKPSPPHSSTT